jgi:L-arabinose isomerase
MTEHVGHNRVRVGLFSIGLEAYWSQFGGLKERLSRYNHHIAERLESLGPCVINLGMIDAPEGARDAGHRFRAADVDVIFLYVSTYALSSTVLPVVRRSKVPVIILNLAPGDAIDYAAFNQIGDRRQMTAEWLAWCQGCAVPEIANVLRRSNISFFQITGTLEEARVWDEIGAWVEAAQVAYAMEHNRLGLLGHYYGGMLDIYSDLTLQSATFGCHVEMIEADELAAMREQVSAGETEDRVRDFHVAFDIQPDCLLSGLQSCARTSVALDRLVAQHALGSLAYYYRGTGNHTNEDTVNSIILGTSLLTARGVPVAGEYEIKNVQAMKILDLFGSGGSFTEYYGTDFSDDVVLMGHDGPGHIGIAEGKIKVRPLQVYHGKAGLGLSVEMSVKNGPITLLSVVETVHRTVEFLVAEGESVRGPILAIGNTNSRYRFPLGARRFVEEWNARAPAHHCAVGLGHMGHKLEKLGSLLGLKVHTIC